MFSSKIIPFDELASWRAEMRVAGRRVVCTNGVFDLLHHGHAQYLADAATYGDVLLVCINDDASVTALKGPDRPLNTAYDRAFMLAALESVGAVTIFSGERATEALRLAQPDVYVKGGDYTEETLNPEERAVLKAVGSDMRFIPFVSGFSTTNLVKRMSGENLGKSVLNELFHRRSIRKYQAKAVSDDDVRLILRAGMAAPSARATYPRQFLVLTDKNVKYQVAQALPNGAFLANCPVGIMILGNQSKACGGELSYMIQDCAASQENMLLAASALGLGACWLGVHPRQERIDALNAIFNFPPSVIPIAALALGYPDEEKLPHSEFDESVVFYNRL